MGTRCHPAKYRHGADAGAELQRSYRTGGCIPVAGGRGREEWRSGTFEGGRRSRLAAFVHAAFAGPRFGDSYQRRDAAEQLPFVATGVRGDLCYPDAVAGVSRYPFARRYCGVSEARAAVRRVGRWREPSAWGGKREGGEQRPLLVSVYARDVAEAPEILRCVPG